MKAIIYFIACLASISQILSYKILLVVTPPARSHYILLKAQADILHDNGHEVTLISSYASKTPKYREISVPKLASMMEGAPMGFEVSKMPNILMMNVIVGMSEVSAEILFANEDVQKLMNDPKEQFDLVIFEHFMSDSLIGFGVKFNCPVIASSTTSITHWIAKTSGNPTSPATNTNIFMRFPPTMNIWERTANVAFGIVDELFNRFILSPSQERMYNKYFAEEAKWVPYSDLSKKVAFTFLNSHPSIGVAKPLLPNTVEVGGYHCAKANPLSKDLQTLLDSKKKHGVIFFSMGSNLKSSTLSLELRTGLLKLFGSLKETVLWKFEEDLPEKPDNLIISSWLPQDAILAHPNTKVFITHGGLLSLTEAASAGKPLVVIPIFGDQYANAAAIVEREQGVQIEYSNFTADSVTWALNEVLGNPKYSASAKKIQQFYHDRPMSPQDTINYYAEHVIRTGGAPHLSPPGDLCLASYLLLDVTVLLMIPTLLVLWASVCLCKKCFCRTKKAAKTKTN